MTTPFGDLLREWRRTRRFSQLDLSLEAETSARHLSFIESGRSKPSRAMVLRLASALEMPRSVVNQALSAAGFAAVYPQYGADAAALAPIRAAVERTLQNHEPFPAIAIDRTWSIVAANAAAAKLFFEAGHADETNLLSALLATAESGAIENWEETALLTLQRLRAEIAHLGEAADLSVFAGRIARHKRLDGFDISSIDLNQAVIPTVFRIGRDRVRLFSIIAQFGSVQDVTASELRIEMMFPADEASRQRFERAHS